MATISRCQSPTNPIIATMSGTSLGYYTYHNRSHHTLLALSQAQSDRNFYNRPSNQLPSYSQKGTVLPELCLEHIWTESINLNK
jgi:hypothetical protein